MLYLPGKSGECSHLVLFAQLRWEELGLVNTVASSGPRPDGKRSNRMHSVVPRVYCQAITVKSRYSTFDKCCSIWTPRNVGTGCHISKVIYGVSQRSPTWDKNLRYSHGNQPSHALSKVPSLRWDYSTSKRNTCEGKATLQPFDLYLWSRYLHGEVMYKAEEVRRGWSPIRSWTRAEDCYYPWSCGVGDLLYAKTAHPFRTLQES